MTLFSELRAADSVDELIDIDISDAPTGTHSIILSASDDMRLRIEANHAKIPMVDGKVAWDRVFMIKIMGVQHGS